MLLTSNCLDNLFKLTQNSPGEKNNHISFNNYLCPRHDWQECIYTLKTAFNDCYTLTVWLACLSFVMECLQWGHTHDWGVWSAF